MLTTIVTVTYNSADKLAEYWSGSHEAQWVVVDNASTDETVDVATRLGAHVISLRENVGFARANNIGARSTDSPYLLFANPDLSIGPNGVQRMERLLEERDALIAPQLRNPDGTLQPNGRSYPFLDYKVAHMAGRPRRRVDRYQRYVTEGVVPVAWVMGAALGVRRTTFETIGGWNERYFLYYEDAEICLRAQQHGIPVLVDGESPWLHGWGRETKSLKLSAWRREFRSAALFYRSYPEFLRLRPVRSSLRAAAPEHFNGL